MIGDVFLCETSGDISLCLDRDIELCTECVDLELTGDDEPEVGSVYVATGGFGSLTFSFTGGTISNTGEILTISGGNDCKAVVSVTDECPDPGPQIEEIEVRLPGGEWSGSNDTVVVCSPAGGVLLTVNVTRGVEKYTYGLGVFPSTYTNPDGCPEAPADIHGLDRENKKYVVLWYYTQDWICS